MIQIYSATQNQNKLKEINALLDELVQVRSINEFNLNFDLPETGSTLTENALQKARFIYNSFKVSCFSDDSGLEIEALNGQPGVLSARFAGEKKNDQDNIDKVLFLMQNQLNRNARFKTVIALIINGEEHVFEGKIEGKILFERIGTNGFGYDPIFKPNASSKSFAQMLPDEKNSMSHRSIAVKKMVDFLKSYPLH